MGSSAAASASFFFMPWEYSSVSFFSSSSRSIIASNSWHRWRTVAGGSRYMRPMKVRYSRRRQVVEQGEVLRHHADPAFDGPGGVGRCKVAPENPHRAAGRRQQAGEHLDGGGFARAVRAEKAVELSRLDAQVEPVHRAHRPEAARQSLRLHGKHLNSPILRVDVASKSLWRISSVRLKNSNSALTI